LMTIGMLAEPELSRPLFAQMKSLFEEIKTLRLPHMEMQYLSMGMSNDYVQALEEGSNMLRIGTAIFGERNYGVNE
ncbi:MAG TPA: YggS family pyridoxal phosphate-dependent enzyme, partial [Candidatus Cloacimonas sp.]|nr:YggS family pyridoxal phosphate-dependent enzyme [Candidatus Cloacimonas sp.]